MESIVREEEQLYGPFEKRMRGHFQCRKEGCQKPAVFMVGQQLVCNMCLRQGEMAQAVPLSALDLRPEAVLRVCSGADVRKEAEAGIEQALCRIESVVKLLRQRVRTGLPAAGDPSRCAEMLRLQLDGKRLVVEGRELEGLLLMRRSWALFQELRKTLAAESEARINQYYDTVHGPLSRIA